MNRKQRFEKMELDSADVPKKPSILEKLKFKRKLELGNEAQAENINQDIKRASADLDKQIEANERRRAIIRQEDMARTIEKVRKDELLELEIKKQYALERKQKAKDKIWLFGIALFFAGFAIFVSGRTGLHFLVELAIAVIVGALGYGRRNRW